MRDELMAGCKQSIDTDKCESLEFNRKASGCRKALRIHYMLNYIKTYLATNSVLPCVCVCVCVLLNAYHMMLHTLCLLSCYNS